MKKIYLSILVIIALFAVPATASAGSGSDKEIEATMDGSQEVPPVVTTMTGKVEVEIDHSKLKFELKVNNNTHDIFAAHIHCASPGSNGPVGVTLFSGSFTSAKGTLAKGTIKAPNAGNGCGWTDIAAVAAAIQSGNAYANVHTTAASGGVPSGEIRGNLPGDDRAPRLDLRVNYGHDWVESFYEAGHKVRITVTESDGVTVKATARVRTEPGVFDGIDPGFQTRPEDWKPAPPDLQPYDWVYAKVDNKIQSQVQLGDISGTIDLAADSIQGTITAPWFSDEVLVECHPWGSPQPAELKFDTILPDGNAVYSCSWAGEWDIQPRQDVGASYYGADGHWVSNAFVRNPHIVGSVAGDWFWTSEFDQGPLDLSIYESDAEGAPLLWQGSREADEAGFIQVFFEDHGQDLVPGNIVVVSEGGTEKRLVLETITMDIFNTRRDFMAGSAPPGREVVAVAGMAEAETQSVIHVIADPVSGAWSARFKKIKFDITEAMRPWSFAQILDEDGDASEAGTPPVP